VLGLSGRFIAITGHTLVSRVSLLIETVNKRVILILGFNQVDL